MDEIANSFRLNVTAVSESCNREILQHSSDDAGKDNGRTVVIWNRKDDLTKDVYLEESQSGQLRVVKQVTTTDKSINYRSEIDLMGRISRATDKPLFVQFIGWFPYKNHVCLAMEYCPYGDLKSYYTRPIPEAEARNICTQLLDGLEVLHSLGIVHRDIKPENVLVFQKTPMKVKITDFGVSKRALEGQTEHRTACGTMGFMAPEVLHLVDDTKEDSTFTSAVDIWSLGCLLYYILTKQTPFSKYELLRDYAKGRTAFPDGHLKEYHVSRQGRKFIERLLDPLPEARPSASVDLTNDWTIPDTGEESIYSEPPSPGDADPSGFSRAFGDSTQPSINDAQWIGFPNVPFELGPLSDNDMVLQPTSCPSRNNQHLSNPCLGLLLHGALEFRQISSNLRPSQYSQAPGTSDNSCKPQQATQWLHGFAHRLRIFPSGVGQTTFRIRRRCPYPHRTRS
ncbi:hypothetical protein ABZX51_007759 [Aspergillus tubingensis]